MSATATVRPALTFDIGRHRYFLGERELPGITRVLVGAGLIDGQWFNERARDRGTAVHLATQFLDEGDLDAGSIDPEVAPRVEAWGAFRAETGFALTESPELLVASPTLGYATQIDRVGTLNGERWVLNLKTGAPYPWHAVQTAGEALAYSEWCELSGSAAASLRRGSVELRADGTYRLHPHTDRTDFARFRAAVLIHQTKESWR